MQGKPLTLATQVGKVVARLKKHPCEGVKSIAISLRRKWEGMLDETNAMGHKQVRSLHSECTCAYTWPKLIHLAQVRTLGQSSYTWPELVCDQSEFFIWC